MIVIHTDQLFVLDHEVCHLFQISYLYFVVMCLLPIKHMNQKMDKDDDIIICITLPD